MLTEMVVVLVQILHTVVEAVTAVAAAVDQVVLAILEELQLHKV